MVEKLRSSRLAQNLRRSWEQALPMLVQLAVAGFSALLAGTTLFGNLAPFGVALVAGVPQGGLLAATAGAVVGSAISLPFSTSGKYLAGLLAAGAVRLLLTKVRTRLDPAAASSLFGAAALLAAQAVYTLRLGEGPLAVFNTVSEGLLAIGMAVMFSIALPPLAAGRPPLSQPGAVQGAAVICAGAALLGLGRIYLLGVNLGCAALGVLLLALALSGAGRAAVMALAGAVMLYLGAPANAWMGLGLGAAGLAAAAFRDRGRPAMAGCFFAASCLGLFGAPEPLPGLWYLVGAGVSALVFLALPVSVLEPVLEPGENAVSEAVLTSHVSARLYALSDALCQVGTTVEEVCRHLPGPQVTLNDLYDRVAEGPCAQCPSRTNCWVAHCSDTMDGLTSVKEALSAGREITSETLPGPLAALCVRPAVLAGAISRYYSDYLTRRTVAARTGVLRSALTQQYTAVADALGQVAGELFEETVLDNRRAAKVSDLFYAVGLPPLDAAAVITRDGRCRVTVKTGRTGLSDEALQELCAEVSACCGRRFVCTRHTARGAASQFEFYEAAPYEAQFATAGRSAAGGVSADAVKTFCDVRGRAHMILCDGMGTGKAAAVDGVLAATLSRQLIDAGFEGASAARLVNVALSLKGEDAGATLDLLTVDLYTGRCDLFKAGAAPTYVVKRGRAVALATESLPVGILGGVVGRSAHTALGDGSLAVMVSDGAISAGDEWLKAELERLAAEEAKTVADALLEGASRRETGHRDDITIAVLRLDRRD